MSETQIQFNVPVAPALQQFSGATQGDGKYTALCNQWFELNYQAPKCLLTTSCTHALEMAAILLNIQPGDEIIMPSYTFVSTANAFVLRGAKIVFVDVRPDTMNIDETLIEAAITDKTKVIVPVHYAGVACEMAAIMAIAKKHNLYVVEDAAQGVQATYKGKALGTIGDLGCFSFHATKNYSMGEGGALLVNNEKFKERAEIIREKGTNRSQFFRGQVDKYSWVDVGSSYLPSDILAAYLWEQLQRVDEINDHRLNLWQKYFELLKDLVQLGWIEFQYHPKECKHNAHMFYIKCKDLSTRTQLINYLKDNGVQTAFHYVPLHSSVAGEKFSIFQGEDKFTTVESERLVRLPLHNYMNCEDVTKVCALIADFYRAKVPQNG